MDGVFHLQSLFRLLAVLHNTVSFSHGIKESAAYRNEEFVLFQGDSLSEDISVVDDAKRLVVQMTFCYSPEKSAGVCFRVGVHLFARLDGSLWD